MGQSRREFLRSCGAGAAAWATASLIPGRFLVAPCHAAQLPPEKLNELSAFALEQARKAGAQYADIRINRYRSQVVNLRSHPEFGMQKLNHTPLVSDSESFGFGVRVLAE